MTHAEFPDSHLEAQPIWTACPPDGIEFRRLYDPLDLEFSELGRNGRLLPGWYILPGIAMGAVTFMVLAALML